MLKAFGEEGKENFQINSGQPFASSKRELVYEKF